MGYFTKWPETIPISEQEASTVVEALIQNWVSRFGDLIILHSDQDTNFYSAIFTELCRYLGGKNFEQQLYIPNRIEMVERFDRTVLNHLSLLISKNQTDW